MASSELKSSFLRTMVGRGFVHQCTDMAGLDALLSAAEREGKSIAAYSGFDCTAPSLHAGSLVQIMMLRWLQKCGHKPIVLMGGGTTKIGDPSGKDEARQLLAPHEIDVNMAKILQVFESYVSFGDGKSDAVMVNNAEWLDELKYIDFLRDYGRHFSVNRMLTMESVKRRLEREQNLSFLEFNYMVLQAYDFAELYRQHGCRLQMGGSDQWGNIVSGVELNRRIEFERRQKNMQTIWTEQEQQDKVQKVEVEELYGLTSPLLTTSSGTKMGKTAQGAVWLNAEMLSPYEFWQYWRNVEDADVGRFLRLFTELPLEEIAGLEKLPGARINEAKIRLATEVTALCHGEAAAREAAETAHKVFVEGAAGDALPEITVAKSELHKGIAAYQLFHISGLAESASEARRLIRGGGAKINDQPVTEEAVEVNLSQLQGDGYIKLSAGRKRHVIIRPQ